MTRELDKPSALLTTVAVSKGKNLIVDAVGDDMEAEDMK